MTRRTRGHLALCALLCFVLSQAACDPGDDGLTPPTQGSITGTVVVWKPVAGANVEVHELDEEGRISSPPRFVTRTDSYGRFFIQTGQFPGVTEELERKPYLVTAYGGNTLLLGTDEATKLYSQAEVVVTSAIPGSRIRLTLSPLTTLAKALGDQRFALGLEPTYNEAMIRAYELMSTHFDVDDLRRIVPDPPDVAPAGGLTIEVKYMLALSGLFAMEQSIAARSGQSLPPFTLLEALIEDAQGPDAIFDGRGPDGIVTVGDCMPACELGPQTLRVDLAESLMADFIPSSDNGTGLDFPDIAQYLDDLSESTEPDLFGGTPALGFTDTEAPEPVPLASPFFDESESFIAFDADLQPVHRHLDSARMDLATVLGGPCDQVLHKHVDTLRADTDDNPLRWRVAVPDDLVGTAVDDIRAVLRPGGSATGHELEVTRVTPTDGASPVYEVRASGNGLDALASIEGRFEIEIQTQDRLGNRATPLVGCWQHVPRAAPVRAGPLAMAQGPGSLAAADLDNDDVVTLLGGQVPADQAAPLVRIPVTNGSAYPVYLTPHLDELAGTYDRTWIAARALVREDTSADTCLQGAPPACSLALPREPRSEDRVSAAPLPAPGAPGSFVALRVVDPATGLAVPCDECRPGEARLDPGRAYEVQVVATTLGFLLPAGVDPGRVARIQVGPAGDRQQLVGVVDALDHVHCAQPDTGAGVCNGHQVFDLYQALTEARIDIQSMRISARTAPAPTLPPRPPRPPDGGIASDTTFSAPVTAAYAWSAAEPRIPAQGSP